MEREGKEGDRGQYLQSKISAKSHTAKKERNKGKMRARKEKKISIEQYLHFFLSQKQSPLSKCLLSQIICIHGFKKIYNVPKKVLMDALDKIDLENLSRSTLKQENQTSLSCALMSMEDIIADLTELDWQECCVSSIQTLKASSSPASNLQAAAAAATTSKKKKRVISTADALSQPPVAAATTSKKKRKRGSSNAHELSQPPAPDTASCASLA